MKVFKEYYLDKKSFAHQTLYLPQDADILSVYDKPKGLTLLTISSVFPNTKLRTFKICATGENIYEDTVRYIGSINSDIGMKHVIEIL
jgi:hypothetical protein